MIRFAFVGFRHGHIFGLVRAVQEHAETEVVAACEEDGATREVLAEDERIKITHGIPDICIKYNTMPSVWWDECGGHLYQGKRELIQKLHLA